MFTVVCLVFQRLAIRDSIIFILLLLLLCSSFFACTSSTFVSCLDAHYTCSDSHHINLCVFLFGKAWWYYTKADINCNWYFSFFLQHFFFSFCVLFGSGLLLLWPLRGCCFYFCVFLFSFCLLFLMLKCFILITFYDADLLLLLFSFCIVVNMQQLILLPRYMYMILSVSFFVHQHHIIIVIIIVVVFSVSLRI